MMEPLEISARTVEEAVDQALSELQLTRSEVEIEVVSEGKGGILGWRSEEATIRVYPPGSGVEIDHEKRLEQPSEVANVSKEVVEKLLSLLDLLAVVEARETDNPESPCIIDISDTDSAILIGRRGQTLDALQYLVNSITSRSMNERVRVTVDVADYRKRRNAELENLAIRVGILAKAEGRAISLEPMSAQERRIIHITLRDDAELSTESTGFGDGRKVVVTPV